MEIVVRAVVVFGFLWVITRVTGRSTLGELSTFELLLYVTMGDLVQQGVTQQDYSVTSAFLAVGVFALLTVALSYVSWRWPGTRGLIRGTAVLVVRNGQPVVEAMRRQRLTVADVMIAAREKGIRRLADIDLAVLEADGKLSLFTGDADSSGASDPPPAG